jgi:hypothetical protein
MSECHYLFLLSEKLNEKNQGDDIRKKKITYKHRTFVFLSVFFFKCDEFKHVM